MKGGNNMANKKVITGLKIGAFIATVGLSVLSKWIDTKEQKQEIEKAVTKYMAENELPKLNK